MRKKACNICPFQRFQYFPKVLLSYFAQKTSLNMVPNWYPIMFTCPVQSDSCSYISNIDISVHLSVSEIATLILSMSLNFIKAWRKDKWYNKRVLIWRFTFVWIKINDGQIGDHTGLFYTTNPVFPVETNVFPDRIDFYRICPSDRHVWESLYYGMGLFSSLSVHF